MSLYAMPGVDLVPISSSGNFSHFEPRFSNETLPVDQLITVKSKMGRGCDCLTPAEVTGISFVCFALRPSCVISANGVDFGLFFLFHTVSNLTPYV